MDISVIIVSYNTKQLLDDCLASVMRNFRASLVTFEVIVVDNVSTDGTRQMLRQKYPTVRSVFNDTNVGFGKANNQGIRMAHGDYILLLNSDTIIPNQAIVKLYRFARRFPNSFVGPKLLNKDGSSQTSCGPFFSLPVVFAALFLKGDSIGLTRWSPTRIKRVDWVSGACMMARREMYLDNLLFDEKILMYMEEVDLLMRARLKGYKTYFYPGSRIIHLGSGSSINKRSGPVLNIYKGLMYVYQKHYSQTALVSLRVLLQTKAIIAWCIGWLTGNSYLTSTYVQAYKLV